MKVKVFTKNKNDKIEFTEDELRVLLDEIYNEGYSDCSRGYVYTTPIKTYPYWTYTTATGSATTSTTTSATIDNTSITLGDNK